MSREGGHFRLLWRFPLLLLHAFVGTPLTVLCQFRFGHALCLGRRSLADIMLCWWAATMCRIFGLRRRVTGRFEKGAQLIAANHISWIDIQCIHAVTPAGFVAKAEIAGWPVMGFLARMGDTVFHKRGSHDSASGVLSAIGDRLRQDRPVAVFPEGGILRGEGVKYFHARLFGAAIDTGAPVQPVMLRYHRDGQRYDDITFLPHEQTLDNFFRLLRQKPCVAEMQVLPTISPDGRKRRDLAGEAEASVRAAFDSDILP